MLTNSQSQITLLINRLDSVCCANSNTTFGTVSWPERLKRSDKVVSISSGDTDGSTDTEDSHGRPVSGASYPLADGDDPGVGRISGEPCDQMFSAPAPGYRLRVHKDPRVLKCPKRKCKRKRFKRQQEFVRHVATRRMPCSSIDCRFLTYKTDFEVNRQCPSCSTQFRYASTFGTHKCNASGEGRKEIKQAYDEMLKEVKRRLGFSRAEKECDVEVPGLLLSDPGSERVNHNQNSIPISMGQGVASSQLALETASATHFEEFTGHGPPQPGNAQLCDLFGDVLHSSHDDQLSGYQSLWDELDPTTSLLSANMGPVVPGLGP